MFEWTRGKLAIRQAYYAVVAIFIVGMLVSFIGIVQLYSVERDRLARTQHQQLDMISGAAARAAFHVDEIQATTILDGLFKFESLEWAMISTDLEQILAVRQRPVATAFTDPLTRYLFSDVTYIKRQLNILEIDQSYRKGRAQNNKFTNVGSIEIRTSPELAGRDFLNSISAFIIALVFQFIILGMTLVVIFHTTLTLPLLSYADAISHISSGKSELRRLGIPKGHENDEFGTVVTRTNQLLKRIENQHQEILHREKVATLGTLLASVSHELSNPLAILAVQSELLIETATDPKTIERGEKIQALTNRCAVIIHRFLTLTRRRELKKEKLNIGSIIDEVMKILDHQFDQAGINTTISVSEDLPLVLVDQFQITQVLLNIVINAEHAVSESGDEMRILINADFDKQEKLIKVSVADNGPGILTEALEHIFEPFYTTKQEGEGTGLGLSYAYDVARSHGGSLTVKPSNLGGAIFTLRLPAFVENSKK